MKSVFERRALHKLVSFFNRLNNRSIIREAFYRDILYYISVPTTELNFDLRDGKILFCLVFIFREKARFFAYIFRRLRWKTK